MLSARVCLLWSRSYYLDIDWTSKLEALSKLSLEMIDYFFKKKKSNGILYVYIHFVHLVVGSWSIVCAAKKENRSNLPE